MKKTELRVRLVATTAYHWQPSAEPWGGWEPAPEGQSKPPDAAVLTEFAGRMCYQSWGRPNPATAENSAYIAHILASKHYSVLEHAGFSVAITGISRACSHEIVRHRHLSVSQLSQRFFDEKNAAYVVPPLFRGDDEAERIVKWHVDDSLRRYDDLVTAAYRLLADEPDKAIRRKRAREAARYVLPNATETMMVLSGNHRTFREVIEKRANAYADAEICAVFVEIFKIASRLAPAIYQDIKLTTWAGREVVVSDETRR